MENEKLLTVKQFADAVGVSHQAVYQQLDKKLHDYVVTIDGTKKIKYAAIDLYQKSDVQVIESIELHKNVQEVEQLCKQLAEAENRIKQYESEVKALKDSMQVLNNQIEQFSNQMQVLSNQLEVKDKQIDQLNILLSQQQQLQQTLQIKLLDAVPEPEQVQPDQEEPKKKKFKLFGRK